MPARAAMASDSAPSFVPSAKSKSPALKSSPRMITLYDLRSCEYIFTWVRPQSVSSWRRTQFAPSGRGEPVIIRAACPFSTVCLGTVPAYIISVTFNLTGEALLAPTVSSERRAYPSKGERLKGGWSIGEYIFCESMRPDTSDNKLWAGEGITFRRISSTARSSVILLSILNTLSKRAVRPMTFRAPKA